MARAHGKVPNTQGIFDILQFYNLSFNCFIMDIYFKYINIIFNIHTPNYIYLINLY